MNRSQQQKLLWLSLGETRTLSLPPTITDSGRSTLLTAPSQLSIQWATPALQSLSQMTGPTGSLGQHIGLGPTSDVAYAYNVRKHRRT